MPPKKDPWVRSAVRVRFARREDEGRAYPLFQGILAYEKGPRMDRKRFHRLWRAQFQRGSPFRFAVAVLEGRLVGHTSLNRSYSTFAVAPVISVEDFFVDPKVRRQGIGRALLAFVEAYARRRGVARLELHVQPKSTARFLYEEAGFRATDYEWWKKPLA